MQNNLDDEVCFLPGWMYNAGNYGFADKVKLWQIPFNKIQPVVAKIFIGDSLGGNVALEWFLEGKSDRVILINPPIKARSFVELALFHLKFIFKGLA